MIKPDDGAGCQNTRLFENRDLALRWARAHPADGFVMQRFIAGPVCSLSLLCGDAGTALLSCNRQRIAVRDGEFQFVEVEVNAIGDRREEFTEMANRIAAAIPGLWGYVGVDFVLTERGAVVLEINPRLTASYVGLSAALNSNVAARVLDLIDGGSRPLRRGPTASSAGVAVGTSPG